MQIVRWPIDAALKKEIDEHYRTQFALSLRDQKPMDIVHKITFDSVAPKLTQEDVEKFVQFVDSKILNGRIRGTGLEVGAGCGFFSSIFAKSRAVEKVYAVEVCENIVTVLMDKVSRHVLGDMRQDKLVGCVGEFDRLQVPDNSVNFVFDFYSLHHSPDINTTLKEIYRILKPGGVLICFDKARANNMTEEDLDKLLDVEYSAEAKKHMGIAPDAFHNRRMNGEKEYRLKDWQAAFSKVGFHSQLHYHIARVPEKGLGGIVKKIISKFPVGLQVFFSRFLNRGGNKNNLEQSHKIYTSLVNHFPKEISFMSAVK